MLFWFKYYNCKMREFKIYEETAWLDMEMGICCIHMYTYSCAFRDGKVSYAMVKKDAMSIKSFYTTLQKKAVCSFGQVFHVCFSILVNKC